MAIKNVKTIEIHKKSAVRTSKDIVFSNKTLEEAKALFQELEKDEVIVKGGFSDNTWILINAKDDGGIRKLSFKLDDYKELILPLKVFTVFQLNRTVSSRVIEHIRHIKSAISVTVGFNQNEIPYIEFSIEDLATERVKSIYAQAKEFFASFIEDITEITSTYISNEVKVRKLINFKDLMIFRTIITDFIESSEEKERLLFFPIILWWKITNIIPLRVIEFINIKRGCLSRKNGRFFITIPRKKKKREFKNIDFFDTLPITEDIYNLINEYLSLTGDYSPEEQLFINHWGNGGHKLGVTTNNFRNTLNRFYQKIVIEKYGESKDIGRIKAMDTRHYTIMSMMFQGCNVLTISRMAGHSSLATQFHYHNHFEEFSDSFVYRLTKIKVKRKSELTQSLINLNENAILKGRRYDKSQYEHNFKMKLFGVCTHNLYEGCINGGECRSCPAFVLPLEDQTKEGFSWLSDYSLTISLKLREQIASLKMATKGMKLKIENSEWLPNYGDEGLKTLSNNVYSLIHQKSEVDTLIMEGEIHG
ncbi:site-specific integrase [Paenibacillus odorifer]|uniref:Tyr recombinase domain-containing protein n=1 Tax=Paenibacillus odorifer TaxID=189426 RepID=A0A1R0Y861_9BACL|nr:site-specific integrase [Paenibacillus odorifer]OMD43476.1 hypothetical protein BSK52_03440 [Paenibacillus odorifer]